MSSVHVLKGASAGVTCAPPPARPDPTDYAVRAADLQRRLRRLTALLRKGESYHVELDAIASELGVLSMDLEGVQPAGRTWRPAPRRT